MVDDQMKNAQYLCLDILLAFVNDMATRAEGVRIVISRKEVSAHLGS